MFSSLRAAVKMPVAVRIEGIAKEERAREKKKKKFRARLFTAITNQAIGADSAFVTSSARQSEDLWLTADDGEIFETGSQVKKGHLAPIATF